MNLACSYREIYVVIGDHAGESLGDSPGFQDRIAVFDISQKHFRPFQTVSDNRTMSRTIDNLVKNELVERRTDSSDRRYTLLSLTAQGRKTCSSINSGADEFFTSVINNLAEENPPALTASLDNLIQAMNATVKTKGGQSCCD